MWVILLGLVVGVSAAFVLPVVGLVVLAVVVLFGFFWRVGLSRAGVRGRLALGLHLVAAGTLAWIAMESCFGLIGRRTPAPSAAVVTALAQDVTRPGALTAADRSAVIAYANGLQFADSTHGHAPPDKYHGQWDKNLLDTLGSIGLVAPEENIHRTWRRDLAWHRGRVQLRITIVSAPGHPGSAVNQDGILLYPGITYVWVDSLDMTNGDSGTARALYIPVDSTRPIQRKLLHVLRGYPWNRAVARWTPAQCWDCVKYDWCH